VFSPLFTSKRFQRFVNQVFKKIRGGRDLGCGDTAAAAVVLALGRASLVADAGAAAAGSSAQAASANTVDKRMDLRRRQFMAGQVAKAQLNPLSTISPVQGAFLRVSFRQIIATKITPPASATSTVWISHGSG